MRRPLLSLAIPLTVCVVAALFAAGARESDPLFAARQLSLTRLSAGAVDALVGTAPDPRGAGRPRGVARCRPRGHGDLRNPWLCSITYRPRFRTKYRVVIRPNGSYVGYRLDDVGEITGCCTRLGGVG